MGSDVATIPLTQGQVATVDEADLPILTGRWNAIRLDRKRGGSLWYARRVGDNAYMHRLLLPGVAEVDHVNRNGLDNRRANLRPVPSHALNIANQTPKPHSSRYHGVHWDMTRGRWRAQIMVNRRNLNLGRFDDEESAARAYDAAAREAFGDFAVTNLEAA